LFISEGKFTSTISDNLNNLNCLFQKGSSPLQYIAAHLSKIHGLDWSPDCETNFATSSQDGTVKV